jgi:hypothetical protein
VWWGESGESNAVGVATYDVFVIHSLEDVDWARLMFAYGSAEAVPAMLRTLRSVDSADECDELLDELSSGILHQGTRYEASAHVVPFLLALATDTAQPGRASIVRFVALLAIGESGRWLPDGFPIGELRAALAADPPDLATREQLRTWLLTSREARRGVRRPADAMEVERNLRYDALRCYDEVRGHVSVLCSLLRDPDPAVGAAAAFALAWFPEKAGTSLPALLAIAGAPGAPEPVVGAALVAAGLLRAPGRVEERALLEARMADPDAGIRRAAATAAARWYRRDAPPATVSILREHALSDDDEPDRVWGIQVAEYALRSLDLAAPSTVDEVRAAPGTGMSLASSGEMSGVTDAEIRAAPR